MKKFTEPEDKPPPASASSTHELLAEILLNVFPANNQWVVEFSQDCKLQTVQLGDELICSENLSPTESSLACHFPQDLLIVCWGNL
ncbi:hypothetical protein [Leptodesmis sp.]|uniref:hypothetical protein n=1 Tax=Leptodesmis sp. TaxID=3100501 RepID=UPI0040534F97